MVLRPGFVLFTLVLACVPSHPRELAPDGGSPPVDLAEFPRRSNPTTEGGLVAYMGGGEGCHLLPPDVEVRGLMDAINRSEPASCASLTDPRWRECSFGAVYATRDGSACICRRQSSLPERMSACPR